MIITNSRYALVGYFITSYPTRAHGMIVIYILHCASLLRTSLASLARANERVHVHNERNFPQAKLDSELIFRFLLNEQGDLYFLLHNNSVHIVLLNLKEN